MSWKRKLATVKSLKADVSELWRRANAPKRQPLNSLRWSIDVCLTQLITLNYPVITIPPTQYHSFFRNLPPLFFSSVVTWVGKFEHRWSFPSVYIFEILLIYRAKTICADAWTSKWVMKLKIKLLILIR